MAVFIRSRHTNKLLVWKKKKEEIKVWGDLQTYPKHILAVMDVKPMKRC